MTSRESDTSRPNPNREVDPESIDLGDDVNRTPGNRDSSLSDREAGIEGGIDPGTTDMGDDVRRST